MNKKAEEKMEKETGAPHEHRKNKKAIKPSNKSGDQTKENNLVHSIVNFKENETLSAAENGYESIKHHSYSYLGLGSQSAFLKL